MNCRSNITMVGCLLTLLHLITPMQCLTHSVLTFTNASTSFGQLVTSSTLVWETYEDPKQMQFAVEGGKFISEDEHYPIYVCRVIIDGVPTSGHTEKVQQKHVCVAALAKRSVNEHFDVLMNKGHLGKIAWKSWRKFNVGIPVGAIRIGDDSYVARHRAQHEVSAEGTEAAAHNGADYYLGRLEQVGLGKIKVVEKGLDKYYDEGEVLVETEPFRYELRDIKLDRYRISLRENSTELATGTLENRGDTYDTMEMVMSYSFNYLQYWGAHEGVAKGLPTKIFEKNVETPAEINWALKHSKEKHENKAVYSKLWPGTAINVTLRGNYVTLDAPYAAKLFAFYYDSESVSRNINAEVRKSYLKDVKMEFSPVYWIENGTVVPTTTTTSTTSTTTHATTTSTNEPTPINEPPRVRVEHVGVQHSGPDSLEKTLNDSTANNEVNTNDAPENMSSKDAALAGIGVSGQSGATTITAAAMTYLIVTLINL
ncbi:hypothetical protein KR044_006131 [Drosophila immigrans]|nr:hypothetical protein KR044_006131 [Drosophila immigrans]